MSWFDKINDAIDEAKAAGDRKIADGVMQAALSEIGGLLQEVVNKVDPDDYPILVAALRCYARSIIPHLPMAAITAAALLETQITDITVVLPDEMRQKGGREMNEVLMIRCGQNCDGESLYRVTVDGKELTAKLTLRETVDALRMVETVRAEA